MSAISKFGELSEMLVDVIKGTTDAIVNTARNVTGFEEMSPFEKELMSIDESMLPEVIAKRIDNVAEVNMKYEEALEKKKEAQARVDQAKEDAKTLVDKAAKLGQLSPETIKFFNLEWSTKNARIEALEDCVKELGEFGVDTAAFQETQIRIQNAILESEEAIMEVQGKQMDYLKHTNDAIKFLYGLNAYSIASTESIVTNLQQILSGAKKKDLGEMAKQQLYMVMDQLKSQENLKCRLDKNEDKIRYVEESMRYHLEKDKQQDEVLEQQMEKDREHDEAIANSVKRDEEHDKKFMDLAIKDEEQDRILDELGKRADSLDEVIKQLNKQVEELEKQIENAGKDKFDKKSGYTAMGIALVSMILSILHFFI